MTVLIVAITHGGATKKTFIEKYLEKKLKYPQLGIEVPTNLPADIVPQKTLLSIVKAIKGQLTTLNAKEINISHIAIICDANLGNQGNDTMTKLATTLLPIFDTFSLITASQACQKIASDYTYNFLQNHICQAETEKSAEDLDETEMLKEKAKVDAMVPKAIDKLAYRIKAHLHNDKKSHFLIKLNTLYKLLALDKNNCENVPPGPSLKRHASDKSTFFNGTLRLSTNIKASNISYIKKTPSL